MRDYKYRRLRDYDYKIIQFTNALGKVWYQIKQQGEDVKFLWMTLPGERDWIRNKYGGHKKFDTCKEAQSYLDNLLENERISELAKQITTVEVFYKENL